MRLKTLLHSDTLPPTRPCLLIVLLPVGIQAHESMGVIPIQATTVHHCGDGTCQEVWITLYFQSGSKGQQVLSLTNFLLSFTLGPLTFQVGLSASINQL